MTKRSRAVVIGVGPVDGLGAGIARKFAAEGHHVLVAGRTIEKIQRVAEVIRGAGGLVTAVQTDSSVEADVTRLFDLAMQDNAEGTPADLVAFNAGNNQPTPLLELSPQTFESFWRMNCLGGFVVAREAAKRFAPLGRGTVIFTGASGSLRGMPGYAHFAASKAGLRMVAQSFAREFGPKGVHVAHVIIDGGIDGERLRTRFPEFYQRNGKDGVLAIDEIAQTYWQLYQQGASAWTHELDLRPFKESF
jgi:NAD(P)-dependent dehydrogenase (short-subunit alcohol dehydrogenase family)